jgi:hypothetical protein
MPLPIGHGRQTGPPRVTRRERWLIGGVLTACAAIAVIVAISFTSHRRTSQHGCIDVSAATVIGGSELYRCGAAARGLCTGASGRGEQNIAFARALADACRKAGLPVPAA